jgi:hypothetical protein
MGCMGCGAYMLARIVREGCEAERRNPKGRHKLAWCQWHAGLVGRLGDSVACGVEMGRLGGLGWLGQNQRRV